MTKPKKRSTNTPHAPTGQRQSARVKGRTPAPPDPQAWDTVTTIADTAKALNKIMTWYVQDIREGRHMKKEWIILHTNFIIEYRDRIHEQNIQKKVIDNMIKTKFPYIHRGTWNTIQIWMQERATYPLVSTTPTPPHTPNPATTNDRTPPESPSAATTAMTAFENLLNENAKIIALTTSPTSTHTMTNSTLPCNDRPHSHKWTFAPTQKSRNRPTN
jgi:hypothetical protein